MGVVCSTYAFVLFLRGKPRLVCRDAWIGGRSVVDANVSRGRPERGITLFQQTSSTGLAFVDTGESAGGGRGVPTEARSGSRRRRPGLRKRADLRSPAAWLTAFLPHADFQVILFPMEGCEPHFVPRSDVGLHTRYRSMAHVKHGGPAGTNLNLNLVATRGMNNQAVSTCHPSPSNS